MSTDAMRTGLLLALVLVNIAFVVGWIRAARRYHLSGRPGPTDIAIGCLTTFLDTLGIGSFAPTTALFKFRGKPPDELIPGTLNIGLNAAGFLETVLFVTAVTVQPALLVCMVATATAGAWLGAGVVSRMPRRSIQLFMGVALLIAAFFFAMKNVHELSIRHGDIARFLDIFPPGGQAFALYGWRFIVAVAVSFVLGALMCIGIGSGRFAHVSALGLAAGSFVGVFVAFYIVKSLPLTTMRWLVTAVVTYAAISMLRSARAGRAAAAPVLN